MNWKNLAVVAIFGAVWAAVAIMLGIPRSASLIGNVAVGVATFFRWPILRRG